MDLHITQTGHGYVMMHGPRLYPGHYATVEAAVSALEVDLDVLTQVVGLRGGEPLIDVEVRALIGFTPIVSRTMAAWDAPTDSARPRHDRAR